MQNHYKNLNNTQTHITGRNYNKKHVYARNNVTQFNRFLLRRSSRDFLSLKSKQCATTQLCLWLLLLCAIVVLTFAPIFYSSKNLSLDAGQTSTGVEYTNSPWVKANNGEALFTSDGGINGETLYDLLTKINQTKVWQDSDTGNNIYKTETHSDNSSISEGQEVYYLSAKNFGKLNDGTASTNNGTANENAKGYAQLQVKLFDGATLGTISTTDNTDLNIDNATTLLWQAVYRSMDSTNDVLTLYMNDGYCGWVDFDGTAPYCGDYKDSSLREVVQKTYTELTSKYTHLDTYTVLPVNIPGLWQSSVYQTGSDNTQSSYALGASQESSGSGFYVFNNGLDDLGTKPSSWTSNSTNSIPYDNDKLWVPSYYETAYRDDTTDGIQSSVVYPHSDIETSETVYASADAMLSNGESGGSDGENDGRSGVWELTGYDRASSSHVWLRSGASNSFIAYYTFWYGSSSSVLSGSLGCARVALHLDLKGLVSDTLAKISVGTLTDVTGTVSVPSNIQTVKSDFNYANYTVKNSTNANYAKMVTFDAVDTSQYNVNAFAVSYGLTKKNITIMGTTGSGTADGLCDYSYTYNNGQLQVTISNVQKSSLAVAASMQALTRLNLQVNNSALNSLLLLTILNGDEKIGEYGFVYNHSTQTASIIVPANTTIKILATKPFGSRVELLLDDASLTPTGLTSYDISTSSVTSKTLVVNLVGSSQWSNAIVI